MQFTQRAAAVSNRSDGVIFRLHALEQAPSKTLDFMAAGGVGCPTGPGILCFRTLCSRRAALPGGGESAARDDYHSIRPMNLKAVSASNGKIILLAIGAVALIIGGVALYRFLLEPDAPTGRKAAVPAYRMQIEGLRFYGMNQGRRVVSIEADRFTLGRGKIGFFSTGLTRKAVIENAIIDVYATATARSSKNAPPSPGQTLRRETELTDPRGNPPDDQPLPLSPVPEEDTLKQPSIETSPAGKFDFGGLFAEETFSSLFPVRNIAEIDVSPVTVRLRNDNGNAVLTRIIATKASVLLREKKLLFTGQVRVSSGNAAMTTEQLVFIPETSRLRTDHPFVLKRGNRTMEGTGLTTDLFLQPK